MKTIILIVSILVSYNSLGFSQNLDSYPRSKRDSILVSIAKEVVLKYGPGYYRDNIKPEIVRYMFPSDKERNPTGENANRVYYLVTFGYDKTKEILEYDYSSYVFIWADSSEPKHVFFGNGIGLSVPKSSTRQFASKSSQKNGLNDIFQDTIIIDNIIQIPYQSGKSFDAIEIPENNQE